MHQNLPPVALTTASLTTLSLLTLAPLATGQGASPAAVAPAAADDLTKGLPAFLHLVPAGQVDVGITAAAMVEAACQTVNSTRPELAAKSPDKVQKAMRNSASALGRKKVHVETFLLGRWPVKCVEYEVFVAQMLANKTPVRPPFGWWRYGKAEDYNKHLADIRAQFPKDENGPVLYWERHGHTLPYALLDERGKSVADHPVNFVSYRDANTFAGWLGMRLPTEAEWVRAARGDGTNRWPWGRQADTDKFTEQALKDLRLLNSKDQVLKVCGSVPAQTGPFGHTDMFGQVWQLVSGLGYGPVNGTATFEAEWKALQRDKVGALMQAPPTWKDDKVIAKGGSYLSGGDPIQLLLDARAPMQTVDVLESVGFRLAKTLRSGYDMLYSLLRGAYNRQPFATDQDIDLSAQIGAERYELNPAGFPSAYHAVTFAPVNWLTQDKALDLTKLLERSHTTPLLIGTLATTEKLLEPLAAAGQYSVLYRKEGMPKDLVDAIKQGHKELAAAKKAKGKDGDKPAEEKKDDKADEKKADDKKDDKPQKQTWRDVLARFGLTEQDVEPKEAANGLDFVRIDGITVKTDRAAYLLFGNEGKVVACIPATNHALQNGAPFGSELALEGSTKGKTIVKLKIGVPVQAHLPKRIGEVHLQVTLDCTPPTAELPWRF
jgi:formylglycine-generating enzyme required for sulfatase activity